MRLKNLICGSKLSAREQMLREPAKACSRTLNGTMLPQAMLRRRPKTVAQTLLTPERRVVMISGKNLSMTTPANPCGDQNTAFERHKVESAKDALRIAREAVSQNPVRSKSKSWID
jgi:hypothetical protein